jgi:hypothetical protein
MAIVNTGFFVGLHSTGLPVAKRMPSNESQLRHPKERPLFWVFAILNVLLMAAAIFIVLEGSDWLRAHPHLAQYRGRIRTVAIAAVVGFPATIFLRNTRHALIRGKSIALSPEQLPQIYAILQRHCKTLSIDPLPELYFSDMNMPKPAQAYRSWKCDYIVLSSKFFQPDLQPMLPVFAFWIGHEIGCLRLNHTGWRTELLLVYVDKILHLSNPLRRVFTYSEDRYGAFLAPEGLPGLIGVASGRLMLPEVNRSDYLKQVCVYGGIWARFASMGGAEPLVSDRIKALMDSGFLKH